MAESSNNIKKTTLSVMIALALGVLTGFLLQQFQGTHNSEFVQVFIIDGVLALIAGLFSNAIRMMVVPLVFVSITLGAASMVDMRRFGKIGGKLIALYMVTTMAAVTIGLVVTSIFKPGEGFDVSAFGDMAGYVPPEEPISLVDQFIAIIPTNPIQAFADGNMLQIIFMALFCGIVMALLSDQTKTLKKVFEELELVIVKIVMLIMKAAPIGVFAMLALTFSETGISTLVSLLGYSLCLLGSLAIQVCVVYSGILLFKGINPIKFYKKCLPVWAVAFSTSSSSATLPVTTNTVTNRIGVDKHINSFTLPLGATMNMDATAIMQGVAIVFFAQILGLELTLIQLLGVVAVCTLASVGTAAVPSGGIVVLASILPMLGIPVELLAIILSVDRILDMCRTVVNVTGDMVCTTALAKGEGAFDEAIFNADN